MIRFIDLRNQDTGYLFAFWNTVTDKFIDIGGDQAWDSLNDLEECAKINKLDLGLKRRLISLCPTWVPTQDE